MTENTANENIKVVEVPEISIADVNSVVKPPSNDGKKGFPWIPAIIVSAAVVAVVLVLIFVFSPIGKTSSTGFGDFKAISSVKVTPNTDRTKAPDVDMDSLAALESIKIASGDVLANGDGDTVKVGDKVQLNYTMYIYSSEQSATGASAGGSATWQNQGNSWEEGEAYPLTVTQPTSSDSSFESAASGQSTGASASGQSELTNNLSKLAYNQKVGAILGYLMPSQASAQGQSPVQFIVFVIDSIGDTASTTPVVSHDVPENAPEIKFDGDKPNGINIPADFEGTKDIVVKVIKEGDGDTVTASDSIKVNYAGYLLNGSQFESSFDSGKPAEFSVAQVIPGWKYGIPGNKVGSKLEIMIPSHYAYGAKDQKDQQGKVKIPADSYLVFYVDILAISDPSAAAGGAQ